MSTLPCSDAQTEAQVFRRRSTVIAGAIVAVVLVVLATLLTVDEWGHGFFPAIAGPITGLALALLALLLSSWPHVIVRDEHLEPHNSFFWFEVPYAAISAIEPIRMGLVVRTHGRKVIPLTGYGTGIGGRIFGHGAAADAVTSAVEAKMARHHQPGDGDVQIVRHWEARNAYAMLIAVVVTALIIVLAVLTYH